MDEKYVVKTDNDYSKPMKRTEAINMVKQYADEGVSAYIISEDEAKRIKNSKSGFNKPKWS
ncbi:MAG: hypothetical protein FH753_04800 [Firmicutes bacterium]|nr:hypothetical protein [Bacillota bacterium]MTI68848.1 hypothetical protein [Bacillota bacterium]